MKSLWNHAVKIQSRVDLGQHGMLRKGVGGQIHAPKARGSAFSASILSVLQREPMVLAMDSESILPLGQELTGLLVTQAGIGTPICTPTHVCGLLLRIPPFWTDANKETRSQM